MAISQVQCVLFLLVSVFFLPALHAVNFEYCNKKGYDFGSVSRVEVSPSPIGPNDFELSITVSGHAIQSLEKGTLEVHAESKNITDLLRRDKDLSIEAGSNFVLPLHEVPLDILEGEFKYLVHLFGEAVGDSKEPIVKLCVDFSLPISSIRMVSS